MTDYSSEEFKKKVETFLDTAPVADNSAAKMVYSLHLYGPKLLQAALLVADHIFEETPAEEKKDQRKIRNIDSVVSLEKWMTKGISNLANKQLLWEKMMSFQKELDPRIRKKCVNNTNDAYSENVVYYFLHCDQNPCKWIMGNLKQIRDPYLSSLLCVAVGFRGSVEDIEPMMDLYDFYTKKYPTETYNQGPLIAVEELNVRFLEKTDHEVPNNLERLQAEELLKKTEEWEKQEREKG